ncbi:hypothetical protein [Hyphomicrobium sp.]|uniref:hypothetical protein n=1 Tax=Hyphomicrobium sp. TaxID=82 RepID=UPI000FB0797C|nr:hypothetical protein [Hyphomicrobium sp.]RUP00046.1 MAG: hypothetical protein EKK30_02705 [Hyphomicrobium sp.]
MADEKKGSVSGSGAGKKPYATIDLKATEISAAPSKGNAASSGGASADVPRPAAARTYADDSEQANAGSGSGAQPGPTKASKTGSGATAQGYAADTEAPAVSVSKRGGFLSHLAAGVVGGALAFGAIVWALPELEMQNGAEEKISNLAQRVTAVEKNEKAAPPPTDISGLQSRIADLENATQKIPSLIEGQARLVAETKAALASAASDAGTPQLIERLGKMEDRLKAMADAGVNDPNATRIEQIAALTGKVSDLETSLATQLTELRSSVTKDVEARIQSAAEASEAARSGTQRIDKDVAGLKTDGARVQEQIASIKSATDRVAADLKIEQDQIASLKTELDGLRTAAAKPGDITAAVQPLSDKTSALEKSVQQVVAGDAARAQSAQRVVLALELQNLRRALDSGQNFSSQLADVKKVAGSQFDLSALEKLQESGVPSMAELTKDFRAVADKIIDADTEPADASVVDRLWAGAKSVVRVRRIDLKADDKSAEAVVGRMQTALADGRLTDVLEEAKDLSPKGQDVARPFLDKVSARVSVDAALANLDTQLKSSIAGVSPQSTKPSP